MLCYVVLYYVMLYYVVLYYVILQQPPPQGCWLMPPEFLDPSLHPWGGFFFGPFFWYFSPFKTAFFFACGTQQILRLHHLISFYFAPNEHKHPLSWDIDIKLTPWFRPRLMIFTLPVLKYMYYLRICSRNIFIICNCCIHLVWFVSYILIWSYRYILVSTLIYCYTV